VIVVKNDAGKVPETDDYRVVSDPGIVALLHEIRRAGNTPPRGVRAQIIDWLVPAWVVEGDPDLLSIIAAGGADRALITRYRDPVLVDMLVKIAETDASDLPLTGMNPDEFIEIIEMLTYQDDSTGLIDPPDLTPDSFGVPTLDLSMQADSLTLPLVKWGTVARSEPIEGTYHFYTSDRKFRALASHPDALPTMCQAAVEINFSTRPDMPRALALYTIYRKRAIALRWQARGLRVWVDLNVDRAYDDLALLGVPTGWQAYANRGYSVDLDHLVESYDRAKERAGGDIRYLVYGGGAGAKALCQQHGWIWAQDDADSARGRDGT
jgi:hypothetical protein